MMTHAHLTSLDRSLIQQRLNEEESFRSIGRELGKDPTTIAKEVKVHIQFRQSGCYGMPYNNCLNRNQCPAQQLCGNKSCKRYCRFCNSHSCASHCSAYQAETCTKLAKLAKSYRTEQNEPLFYAIGICRFSSDDGDIPEVREILKAADRRMYLDKQKSKKK